jgi:hypothetical protein
MFRWGAAVVGAGLLLAFCAAIWLLQPPQQPRQTFRGLAPHIPDGALASQRGAWYVDLPGDYVAPVYRSPIAGDLLAEWGGGVSISMLGTRFFDGFTDWELVRDPVGNEGWMPALFLSEQPPAMADEADTDYLGPVWWEGEIAICVNPAGGPPGLDGDAFVALVERAAGRWQDLVDGALPLVSRGRCASSPDTRDDRINTVGWADDLGLAIAAQAWPSAERGVLSEVDIRVSRGFFTRLQARDPTKMLQRCVFSTVVHELGHLLGLDHPRSRMLPSSMQAVGASRCDKGQPTAWDRLNLLRRYAPDAPAVP